MKNLPRLINHITRQIETEQKQLILHRQKEEQRQQEIIHLQQEMTEELKDIEPSLFQFYSSYIQNTEEKIKLLQQHYKEDQSRTEACLQILQDLFIQRKQYEILKEQYDKKQAQLQALQENKAEEEYARSFYTRKKNNAAKL